MLDTNVLNRVIDGRLSNEWPPRGGTFVTDIQLQEVLDTSSDERRGHLFRGLLALQLNVIRPSEMPQLFDQGQNFDTGERFMLGMATVWHRSAFPLSFGNYAPAIADNLPPNKRRPANPLRDGFIAEAALINGMTLVTADQHLAAAARSFGVMVEEIP